MKKMLVLATCFLACAFLTPNLANATLIGDEVMATLGATEDWSVGAPLAPPAAVVTDPGPPEFTGGTVVDGGSGALSVDVNVGGSFFDLILDGVLAEDGGADFSVSLTGLDWVGGPGTIVGVTPDPGNPDPLAFEYFGSAPAIFFGDHHVDIVFMYSSDFDAFDTFGIPLTFTFHIDTVHGGGPIPEPSTVILFVSGIFGVFGWSVYRRKKS